MFVFFLVLENWNYASSWEPLCAPVGENRPQQSLANDYFWSAPPVSSVWPMSPWTTLVNPVDTLCDTPPIRTPPGFNRDENDTVNDKHYYYYTYMFSGVRQGTIYNVL